MIDTLKERTERCWDEKESSVALVHHCDVGVLGINIADCEMAYLKSGCTCNITASEMHLACLLVILGKGNACVRARTCMQYVCIYVCVCAHACVACMCVCVCVHVCEREMMYSNNVIPHI